MMANNILWAMAPEYAPAVFESYRRALDPQARQIRAEAATSEDFGKLISRKAGSVAVITIDAAIDRHTLVGWWSGTVFAIGQDAIRAAIAEALADNSIRAILLSINSPGGVVAGTRELAEFIAEATRQKPIAAYVDGLAASAAYWLAAATGRIFAPATGMVGSIGVIMTVADYSAFYQKSGVKFEHITSGKFKSAGRDDHALTDEERAYFQGQIAQLHAIFKADVAKSMKIKADEAQWAEAQILVGEKAAALGLVSSLARDEAAAIEILTEENMPEKKLTLELLAAEAPELLAQIRAEAVKDTELGQAAKLEQATKDGASFALAAIRAVCSEADAKAVEDMLARAQALKLTPDQLAGVAQLFPKAAAQDNPQSEILAALRKAHEAPVNAEPAKPAVSALVADAERRSNQ